MAKALNKLLIEIEKSQANLDVLYRLRLRPISNPLNLFDFHVKFSQKHDVVEELHLILMKLTFFQVDIKQIFSQLFGNLLNGISIISFISIDLTIIYI